MPRPRSPAGFQSSPDLPVRSRGGPHRALPGGATSADQGFEYESHAVGLDRNELSAFLVAAGLGSPQDYAPASLLALNGLRISEALGADIEALGLERGHRTLVVHRKGGKVVTVPLLPRTARAIDLAIGGRLEGPMFIDFIDAHGQRLRRDAAARMVRRVAKAAGIAKRIGRTACGTPSSPLRSTPASRSATSKRPLHLPTPAPPCATTGHGSPWTVTPPTSSPRSSPVPQQATPARPNTDGDHRDGASPPGSALRQPTSAPPRIEWSSTVPFPRAQDPAFTCVWPCPAFPRRSDVRACVGPRAIPGCGH